MLCKPSASGGSKMNKIKIYSPIQVALGAFFGGPVALVFVLWRNFKALGNKAGARKALLGGLLFIAAILMSIPFLPEKFPNFVLPIAYSFAAKLIAETYQLSKAAIAASETYTFQLAWNVVGIIVCSLFIFVALALAWLTGADMLGLIPA